MTFNEKMEICATALGILSMMALAFMAPVILWG